MKKIRAGLISVACFVVCLMSYGVVNMNKDSLILRYHYSGWRTFSTIATVCLAVSTLALIVNLAMHFGKKVRLKKAERAVAETEKQRRAEENESKKLRDPEDVRQFFIRICKGDHCVAAATKILEQLNDMNDYQNKFERLLEINDISAAENTKELLQDIENSICDGCKEAINRYVIGDYEGFNRAAEKVFEKNAGILKEVKSFLENMAEFAGGQNNSEDAAKCLASYNETIREAMQREVF